MKNLTLALLLLSTMALQGNAQQKSKVSPQNGKGPIGSGRAGGGPISKNWKVAPDLSARLATYKSVRMPYNPTKLSLRERQMVDKLVDASQYLEAIFWRQNDAEALTLYQQLAGSASPQDQRLRKLLFINAGRFDMLDNNQPLIGADPMPPGHSLYPAGLTRAQVEEYVKAHPEQQSEIYSPYTVIRRHDDKLEAFPYHMMYRPFLEPAAKALRAAAALSADPAFANFLRLRADALLSDDYYPSDLAWVDLKDPKFDIILAPYETYIDDLLGVKTSYGGAVLIRNDAESKKLAVFQEYGPDIQDALPLPAADRPSKHGLRAPMEVVDAPFRAADLEHGYQAVADNLPNDPRIHKEKGSKKIFFKNFMDARVNYIILPLARRAMRPDQAALVSGEGYLAHTMMHEISHGLGPDLARIGDKQLDINEAIGPVFSGLEEAKADVLGVFGLDWLMDHGYLPKSKRDVYYASYVADMFRAVRFGVAEAHGKAEMMEFNYLAERGVITRDPATGRYALDFEKMQPAIDSLAKELLDQEATGDRARAEAWFNKYGAMPAELKELLEKQKDIPSEIAPVFSFPVKVR
jgi:hypothetical protein